MKKTLVSFTFGLAAAVVAVACGGADPERPTRDPKPVPTGTGTVQDPTDPPPASESGGEACVAKGAKGNAVGVGAYCDKTQTRCKTGQFCTADFGAPEGAHFCTIMCATDSDCGDGAICYAETRGKGCVPNACVKQ